MHGCPVTHCTGGPPWELDPTNEEDVFAPADDDVPLFPVADDDVAVAEEALVAKLLVGAAVEAELPGALVDAPCDEDVPAVALEDDRRDDALKDEEEGRVDVAVVLVAPALDAAADVLATPPDDDDDDVLPASEVPPVEQPAVTNTPITHRCRQSIHPLAMLPPVRNPPENPAATLANRSR